MQHGHDAHGGRSRVALRRGYWTLAINLILSFVVMYLAMFSMVWSVTDFFNNLNMAYMTLLMWAPMAIIMLLTMGSMYADRRLNMILYLAFAFVLALSFVAVRDQLLIGDKQFVRSMIPHHAGAVLMCNRAPIRDPEIRNLCFGNNGIVQTQTREIAQMRAILNRLGS
jgi:hypothetical protein